MIIRSARKNKRNKYNGTIAILLGGRLTILDTIKIDRDTRQEAINDTITYMESQNV